MDGDVASTCLGPAMCHRRQLGDPLERQLAKRLHATMMSRSVSGPRIGVAGTAIARAAVARTAVARTAVARTAVARAAVQRGVVAGCAELHGGHPDDDRRVAKRPHEPTLTRHECAVERLRAVAIWTEERAVEAEPSAGRLELALEPLRAAELREHELVIDVLDRAGVRRVGEAVVVDRAPVRTVDRGDRRRVIDRGLARGVAAPAAADRDAPPDGEGPHPIMLPSSDRHASFDTRP